MRAARILRDKIGQDLHFLHAKRAEAFWRAVSGVMLGGQLWLTALGRSLPGNCNDKHRIKAVDRLLGSEAIHRAHLEIYAALARLVLRGVARPTIAVDWTGVTSEFYGLSATVCFSGRALPLLTCIYPKELKCSPKAHRDFLAKLYRVVPHSCKPTILTDAGFYSSWFEGVRALGWDFVGRVRNSKHRVRQGDRWMPVRDVYALASRQPKDLGELALRKSNPATFRFVLSAARRTKGRKRLTRSGTVGRNTADRQRTDQAREPWLLATSLSNPAATVVALYGKRMQIEEKFRDLKSHRHGWSLEDIRCRSAKRIEVMLLVAAFAAIATHTVGLAAQRHGMQVGLQANTLRTRPVFSTFFLGRLILRRCTHDELSKASLCWGYRRLAAIVLAASVPG
ncbi:MAG TPA: IS4 family transposase [Polyangiaceae bacterium]|nr:IS4 family transposase [Polyangiaceae bacterium]HMR79482.1 IS4 family transposase [Polyangiaceae bacterium]